MDSSSWTHRAAQSTSSASPAPSPRIPPEDRQEAPYLTHLVRHHGLLTLTPPPNLGRQRQSDQGNTAKVVKRKKKRKKEGTSARAGTEAEIEQAVLNAGRTTSSRTGAYRDGELVQGAFRPRMAREVSGESNGGESWRGRDSGGSVASTSRAATPEPGPSSPRRPPLVFSPSTDSHAHQLPSPSSPPPAYLHPPSPPPLEISPMHSPLPPPGTDLEYAEDDPFVVAWEADRAAGVELEVRIRRDIERRRVVREVEEPLLDLPGETLEDLEGVETEVEADRAEGEVSGRAQDNEDVEQDDAGEEAIARPLFASSSTSNPYSTPAPDPTTPPIAPSTPQQTSNRRSEVGAKVVEEVVEEEEEEEEEGEDEEPARTVSSDGRRRLAEAAERRIALESLERLSIVEEQVSTGEEGTVDGSSSSRLDDATPTVDVPPTPTPLQPLPVVESTPRIPSIPHIETAPVDIPVIPIQLPPIRPPVPPSRPSLHPSLPHTSTSSNSTHTLQNAALANVDGSINGDDLATPISPTPSTLTRARHIRRPAPPPPVGGRRVPRVLGVAGGSTARIDAATDPTPSTSLPLASTSADPPRPSSPSSSFEEPSTTEAGDEIVAFDPTDDFVYTDLDILLARLEDHDGQGSHYDELLLVSEVMGSANDTVCTLEEVESLSVARVEVQSRRVDKQGRVKLKLSVVGLRCLDCAICLARFRKEEMAVVLPKCLHIYHAKCLTSWLLRSSRACPVCRQEVFERPLIDLSSSILS